LRGRDDHHLLHGPCAGRGCSRAAGTRSRSQPLARWAPCAGQRGEAHAPHLRPSGAAARRAFDRREPGPVQAAGRLLRRHSKGDQRLAPRSPGRCEGRADAYVLGPPNCTYGVHAPAACELQVPEAQGSLPRGWVYCAPYRVLAPGLPYVQRTVAPQA